MRYVTVCSQCPQCIAAPKIRQSCYWVLMRMQLAAMRARDPAAKALIFTQFNTTLNWLSRRLQQEGYGYRTISGSMPLKKRAQVIVRSCLAALHSAKPHCHFDPHERLKHSSHITSCLDTLHRTDCTHCEARGVLSVT